MVSTPSRQLTQRAQLPNGIVLLVTANPAADIVSGRLYFRGAGTCAETPEQSGLAHLLAAVLTKGTERLSAAEIAEQVESTGAGVGTDATADYFSLSLKTISADFESILDLVAEILLAPAFPEAEVELERSLAIQSIRSQREQPFNVALDQLRSRMYGAHPYGRSSLGTEATVATLQRADLQAFHRTYLRPDVLTVSLCGRIDLERAIAAVARAFGHWSAPTAASDAPPLPAIAAQPAAASTPRDTQQAVIMLGYLAAPAGSEDYAALKLLNTYLGNGLSSRLFVELREKRGLAYEVSSFFPTRADTSQFVTYIGTAPENTETAIAGLRREVDRLCETVLTAEELQVAKNKLLGQYALGKQSNAQIAQLLGWYETLGLGLEYDDVFQASVAAVTAGRARVVARRYFAIAPYLSIVGPEAAITTALQTD